MREGTLESCKQFYALCVARDRIPVSAWDGSWYYSNSPEDFDNYLAKFNADDRKKILQAASPPSDNPSNRIRKLSQNIPTSQVNDLLERLRNEDPDEFDKLMRDYRCTTSRTTP